MDYILKGIPEGLWRKVKSKCALNGLTIKQLILKLLQGYVEGTLVSITRQGKPDKNQKRLNV